MAFIQRDWQWIFVPSYEHLRVCSHPYHACCAAMERKILSLANTQTQVLSSACGRVSSCILCRCIFSPANCGPIGHSGCEVAICCCAASVLQAKGREVSHIWEGSSVKTSAVKTQLSPAVKTQRSSKVMTSAVNTQRPSKLKTSTVNTQLSSRVKTKPFSTVKNQTSSRVKPRPGVRCLTQTGRDRLTQVPTHVASWKGWWVLPH